MRIRKSFAAQGLVMIAAGILCSTIGCIKEYSYEQRPADTTTVVTPPSTSPEPASCAGCHYSQLPDSSWRFNMDGVTYCGKVERSLAQFQGTALAFAGPSACSADSGFVATVKINDAGIVLNTDLKNVAATLSCYYYDKLGSTYPFISPMGEYQSLTITDYNHQTRIAVGTFSGIVRGRNGVKKELKDGRFRITL